MPFYATDFLSDAPVMAMTLEERGAYITLLCIAWNEEGIPADHTKLARALHVSSRKFAAIWESVGPCWESDGNGRLLSPRMEEIRGRQREFSERQSRAAKARWGKKPR